MPLIEIALSNAIVSTLIAAIAISCARFRAAPTLTRALWVLVFLKLLTPPIFSLPCVTLGATEPQTVFVTPLVEVPEPVATTAPVTNLMQVDPEATGAQRPSEEDLMASVTTADVPVVSQTATALAPTESSATTKWSQRHTVGVVLAIWLGGAVLTLVFLSYRIWEFRQLLTLAEPGSSPFQKRVGQLASRLGLRRPPKVLVISGLTTPMIWAPMRAYLIMPKSLVHELDHKTLDSLITHELAHLRNGDQWVRRLEIVVAILYWWHPVVWLAKRQLREAEEQICDAWVTKTLPGVSTAYANTLIDIVSQLSGQTPYLPPAATGLSQFRLIKRRITMILQGTTSPRLSLAGWIGLVAISALLLPTTPTLAHPDEDKPLAVEVVVNADPEAVEMSLDLHPEVNVVAATEVAGPFEYFDEYGDASDDERDDRPGRSGAKATVGEMIQKMQQAVEEMDAQIRGAVGEARREIEEMVTEADDSVQREMLEIDFGRIIKEAVAEAPQPVRVFIKEVNPAEVVAAQLAEVEVRLQDMESDDDLRRRVQRKVEGFLSQHIDQLAAQARRQVRDIQREIQRETRQSPKEVQAVLAEIDFDQKLAEVADEVSPVVKQFIAEVNVQEMVDRGLSASEGRGRAQARQGRERRERAEEHRQRSERARDAALDHSRDDRNRYQRLSRLERKLERLLREAEELVEEIEDLRENEY